VKIEDYRRLALENGLVIMQIDQPLAPYRTGSYAGFSPEEAMFYHQEGIAHPKDGPVEFPKAPPEPPPPGPALVDIPKDWRSLNRLQKAHIVAALQQTQVSVKITTKEADDAIEAELARRERSEAGRAPAKDEVPSAAAAFPAVTAASLPR
jgi:hypothetical protein